MSAPSKVVIVAVIAAASMHAASAFAQAQPRLEPLPDIPPPPRLSTSPLPDDPESPTVTIREEEGMKVEEFRSQGRIYAIRVTPKVGKPYMLIDPDGKSTLTTTGEIGNGIRPAQWTLFEW